VAPRTKLSVIIPVYNEEQNLPLLLQELNRVTATLTDVEPEFLFIDDGSRDQSLAILRAAAARDPRVRAVSFSRNFGSYVAVMAGLQHSTGDAIANISADLQDPPELLPRLLEKWREGFEVVWGYRHTRDDPVFTILFSRLYATLMRRLALPDMPRTGVDVCLVDRKVAQVVVGCNEKNTSVFGLIMWSGFRQAFVPYARQSRKHGRTKWTLSRKIKLFTDSFVAFSFFPIRLVSYLGIAVSLMGFAYAAVVVLDRILHGTPIRGWPSLMVAIVTLSGVQLLMLGIVAEYLWRTFEESRKRPSYIVKELIGFEEPAPGSDRHNRP